MTDYKDMYFKLAAKVANAVDLLVEAQQEGEDAFLEGKDSSEADEKLLGIASQ